MIKKGKWDSSSEDEGEKKKDKKTSKANSKKSKTVVLDEIEKNNNIEGDNSIHLKIDNNHNTINMIIKSTEEGEIQEGSSENLIIESDKKRKIDEINDKNYKTEQLNNNDNRDKNADIKLLKPSINLESPYFIENKMDVDDEPLENTEHKENDIPFLSPSPSYTPRVESIDSIPNYLSSSNQKSARPYNPFVDGCRSVDCYQRLNFIDQGTYGMVFKAKCLKTNEIYALKQVKFGNDTSKVGFPITALREINILLALQHPNIVKVREMVVGSSIDKIFMVMEYCENDLKACMKISKQSFSIAEVKQLMIQLLRGVEHMHKHWYIHRDLKTSNLLYSNNGVLSICDFGLARKYGSPIAPYTFEVVTLWYRSTELLLGSRVYSTPVDMWSVGCIFAEILLGGEALFPGQGEIDQITKIFKILGAPNEQRWPGYSNLPNVSKVSCWRMPTKGRLREVIPMTSFSGALCLNDSGMDLLSKMLTMDPKKRISASEALEHPWLVSELPSPTPIEAMPKFKSKTDDTI